MTPRAKHADKLDRSSAESVWDYPRPPAAENCVSRVRVVFGGEVIVDSTAAMRVLETSHPPTYYVPLQDVKDGILLASKRSSFCEYKGIADYFDVVVGQVNAKNAAWTYASPTEPFAAIRGHVAFYAHLMEQCFVGEEPVHPQAGGFYGGWVTSNITGPFKGGPGTGGW